MRNEHEQELEDSVKMYVDHDGSQEWQDADLLRQFVPMTVRDPQLLRHHYAPPAKARVTR